MADRWSAFLFEIMKYLVKAKEMKQFDRNTIEHFGILSEVLIERAALAAFEELQKKLQPAQTRILIVCGNGNNGADGLALARLLHLAGAEVTTLLLGDRTKATPENKKELQINEAYGILSVTDPDQLQTENWDVVVDALFGVGLSRKIEGEFARYIERINAIDAWKLALDIPSGVNSDQGTIMGIAFLADLTVTFSYEKLGMRLYPGQDCCGEIICREVGINDPSFLDYKPTTLALEKTDRKLIPKRANRGNKGTFGKILIIAGSACLAGAAVFSAKAAYKSGAGMVKILTVEENRQILQTLVPEAILSVYSPKKIDFSLLTTDMQWADVIVCGPGLGKSQEADKLVRFVLKNAAVPVVFDADALNLLAKDVDLLLAPHTELVLTPHLGEMARLTGNTIGYIQDALIGCAEEFARAYNVIVALKDARTVTAIPYNSTYVNLSGNNGMATAGSGDALTGVIAALIAQGLQPGIAAPLGVFLHGLAGDLVAEEKGVQGLMVSDLIEKLPFVFKGAW